MSADTPPAVRRATVADRDAVLATILAAFVDDPAWQHLAAGDFDGVSPHFAAALFDGRVGHGSVWVTDDCLAASLWEKHGTGGVGHDESVWDTFRAAVPVSVWDRVEAYDAALHAVGPVPPFWYLGVLATHPSVQGRGWGTAVVAPAFAIADADGLDCWLETSKPDNTEFYARRGFVERIEVDVPGGPTTWWMRRPTTDTADLDASR
jgi:GNAT superfamily N-acetyltransferase